MLKTNIKYEKFKKALQSLNVIYCKPMQDDRSNIDATIQRFEFTFELAWKFLKEYFLERDIKLNYPKEIISEAFIVGLIDDEDIWVNMLRDRNMTSHTYDEKLADEIYINIKQYVPVLQKLADNDML